MQDPPQRPSPRADPSQTGRCSRHRRVTRLAGAVSLLAATLTIAACGGSSSTGSTTVTATQGASGSSGAHSTTAQAKRDVIHNGTVVQRPVSGTGGGAINDDNPGRADSGRGTGRGTGVVQTDPCTLVSRAQAQAIVGGPIAPPQEAPLGPTCIYQPVGARTFVTLTVESVNFAKLSAQLRDRRRVALGGHTAWCGSYGQPLTLVALSGGRVLSVTAPCPVGAAFAAKALSRLKA